MVRILAAPRPRCYRCNKQLWKGCRWFFCRPCRRAHQCRICFACSFTRNEQHICQFCAERGRIWYALLEYFAGVRLDKAEIERRIEVYAWRASQKQDLFQEEEHEPFGAANLD